MLFTAVTEDALKGVSRVLVGMGVVVGGTRGKKVLVSSGVRVGLGVSLGVTSRRVGLLKTGGNILNDELGLTKTNRNYKPMQTVNKSTRIENMSHILKGTLCKGTFCIPSKSKLSSIQFTPGSGTRPRSASNFCH